MKYLSLGILLLVFSSITHAFKIRQEVSDCRFARNYRTADLLQDEEQLSSFLRNFVKWESNFIHQIGVDKVTGFTYDGIRVDVNSGEALQDTLHKFTASSKESIHLAILAKVLENAEYADEIYSVSEVFNLIGLKVETLDKFYKQYPGFGGYLPWVVIGKDGLSPAHDFQSRVPALDNGEMFWAARILSYIWAKRYPNVLPQLRRRFDELFWKGMIRNSRKIFFNETTGKIRAVANIEDVSLDVEVNNYTNTDSYYLDDPYEGELFTWMITLYAQDQFTEDEIDELWVDKRQKLQSVNYFVRSLNRSITVQKGWWFSSHEQWKLLFLPYRVSPTYRRIMKNNERARAWHSVDNKIPGMYGCEAGPARNNTQDTGYFCSGIPEIAFQNTDFNSLVTPYGVFPLLLVDRTVGAVWLHNTIYSPAGQTKYGALEGTGLNGSLISPVLTWDTKITAVLAIMNGTWQLTNNLLEEQGLLQQFRERLEKEYRLSFATIQGEELILPLPNIQVSAGREDFTTCK